MFKKTEIQELKGKGFLLQNDKEHFSVRIISKAGNFTVEEVEGINLIAKKYGKGYFGITSRMCIEIPWIYFEDVEKVMEEAKNLGLRHGGTGKKVRPLVSCKGSICLHGNIDTQGICSQLQDMFFAKDMPSKCKIGVCGCANNCIKANLNDVGILGYTVPKYTIDKCVGCSLCVKSCRQKALTLNSETRKIEFDKEKCVECGACVRACPTKAFSVEDKGAKIFIGGRFGRKYVLGNLLPIRFKEENVTEAVSKILDYYKENAIEGERISYMVERLGIEKVEQDILNIF